MLTLISAACSLFFCLPSHATHDHMLRAAFIEIAAWFPDVREKVACAQTSAIFNPLSLGDCGIAELGCCGGGIEGEVESWGCHPTSSD